MSERRSAAAQNRIEGGDLAPSDMVEENARTMWLLHCVMVGGLCLFGFSSGGNALTCNNQGSACAKLSNGLPDTDCVQAVTTLAIANGGAAQAEGWYDNGTQCGKSRKTGKPCGDKFSTEVCGVTIQPHVPQDPPPPPECDPATDDSCYCDPFSGICAPRNPYDPPPTDVTASPLGSLKIPPQAVRERLVEVAEQNLPVAVDRLLQSLAALSSVHLKARMVIQVRGDKGGSGASDLTEYEYWEAGGRYRVHAYVNPLLGLGDTPDLAFDGSHHQMVMQSGLEKTLSLTAQDVRMVPIGVPNPLFLPLTFLSPDDQDRCVFCELRLADVAAIVALRKGKPAPRAGSSSTAESMALRGGRFNEAGTRFDVRFDKSSRVASIRHLGPGGKELERTEVSDYRPVEGAPFEFPRVIDFRRSDPQANDPWLVVRYVIDQLDVNRTIEDSTFTIPFDTVSKVWDSDAAGWRKYRGFNTEGFCKKP